MIAFVFMVLLELLVGCGAFVPLYLPDGVRALTCGKIGNSPQVRFASEGFYLQNSLPADTDKLGVRKAA